MKKVPTYVYIYTCGHNGTIKFVCGHNGTADITGRTSRSVLSASGHNGTMKIHRGHNGTADTTGRTSRSVLSACGHNGTIKFVCGHNGTADTTGRNTRVPFLDHVAMILMDWSWRTRSNFYRNKLSDEKVRFFIRLTVGAHDPIFAPIFVYDKKSDSVRLT